MAAFFISSIMNVNKLIFLISLSFILFLASFCSSRTNNPDKVIQPHVTGEVIIIPEFSSAVVAPRQIEIWLPPDYHESENSYPVLYMHDGQNLFNPKTSYTGVDWDVDGTMTRLIETGKVRPAIVVGIWNTENRLGEYMPEKPVREAGTSDELTERTGQQLKADNYLRFLVYELKPHIDENYRTLPQPENTFIMGSSMGGLISAYAVAEYAGVFGAAGCVSTHWPIGGKPLVNWFAENLPEPGKHKLYFDYGTEDLDREYEPFQLLLDEQLKERGYAMGSDLISLRIEGAGHNESAWKARLDKPLTFLLGK